MWLSSSATTARMVRIRLDVVANVSMPSISKITFTGGLASCSFVTQPMQSSRFRAKRLTLLVMITSNLPSMAACIMSRKPGRCSVFVPEKPSST